MSRCGSVGWTVSSLSTTLPRFHSSRNPDDPGWDAALADVRSAESSLSGRLRVNVPVVFGRRFVVPVVAELLTRHPRLAVDLVFDDRYVNPVDGGWAMPTMATMVRLLPAGFATQPYRSSDSMVFTTVEGRGELRVADQVFLLTPRGAEVSEDDRRRLAAGELETPDS